LKNLLPKSPQYPPQKSLVRYKTPSRHPSHTSIYFKYIKSNSGTLTGSFDIAEEFALSWSEYSSDQNFSAEYIREKNLYLSEPYAIDSLSPSAISLDSKFTLLELENSPNINLQIYNAAKKDACRLEYQKRFMSAQEYLCVKNWIYTDGYKVTGATTFAVVDCNRKIIAGGRFPSYNSIITAEASAILKACQFASKNAGKSVICTDSFSSLSAISNWNHNDPTTQEGRHILSSHPTKITLLWVPSHQGILYLKEKKLSEWALFIHRYQSINPNCIMFKPPTNVH